MKKLALIAAFFLAGCATTTPDLQTQLTDFCNVATPEIASFQAVESDLSAKAQTALNTAAPLVSTLCASGTVASAASIQTFTQTILPQLTIVAVEYAASKK